MTLPNRSGYVAVARPSQAMVQQQHQPHPHQTQQSLRHREQQQISSLQPVTYDIGRTAQQQQQQLQPQSPPSSSSSVAPYTGGFQQLPSASGGGMPSLAHLPLHLQQQYGLQPCLQRPHHQHQHHPHYSHQQQHQQQQNMPFHFMVYPEDQQFSSSGSNMPFCPSVRSSSGPTTATPSSSSPAAVSALTTNSNSSSVSISGGGSGSSVIDASILQLFPMSGKTCSSPAREGRRPVLDTELAGIINNVENVESNDEMLDEAWAKLEGKSSSGPGLRQTMLALIGSMGGKNLPPEDEWAARQQQSFLNMASIVAPPSSPSLSSPEEGSPCLDSSVAADGGASTTPASSSTSASFSLSSIVSAMGDWSLDGFCKSQGIDLHSSPKTAKGEEFIIKVKILQEAYEAELAQLNQIADKYTAHVLKILKMQACARSVTDKERAMKLVVVQERFNYLRTQLRQARRLAPPPSFSTISIISIIFFRRLISFLRPIRACAIPLCSCRSTITKPRRRGRA